MKPLLVLQSLLPQKAISELINWDIKVESHKKKLMVPTEGIPGKLYLLKEETYVMRH